MKTHWPYLDLHCDTLSHAFFRGEQSVSDLPSAMADVKKLSAGGCAGQLFAIFLPTFTGGEPEAPLYPGDEAYIRALKDIYDRTLEENQEILGKTESLADFLRNRNEGKISAVLSMEDGRAAEGRPENLERFYAMGVRVLGLLWNAPNCFGYPNSPDPEIMGRGLTDFGKEAVSILEGLGIGIDVSHLSDGGFWDVAELARKPFFATHSNCRALNPHPRSMTDEMIRALADHGGVMGVNFYGAFLHADVSRLDSTVDGIARQLRHRINVGGLECAAIGTDFDGIHGELEIPDASRMPELFEALADRGFTDDELEHITHLNAERVLRDILR